MKRKVNHVGLIKKNFLMSKYFSLTNDTKVYKNNVNSSFITNLNEPLSCSENSLVALTDISYSANIIAFRGELNISYITQEDRSANESLPLKIKQYKNIIEQAFGKIIESSAILLKNIIEGIDVDNNLYEERILNLMKNIVSSIVVCIPVLKKKDFDVFIQVYNQNLDQNHDINTIIAKPLIKAKNLQKTEIFTRAFDEVAFDYENRMDQLHQELLNYSVNFKRTLKLTFKNNITIDDFFENLNIFKLINCKIKILGNKVILEFSQNINVSYDNEKFVSILNLKAGNSKIIFVIPKKLNFLKTINVYTNLLPKNIPLQIFKFDGDLYDQIHTKFEPPQYHTINKSFINNILIELKDSDGKFLQLIEKPILRIHIKNIRLE